MLDKESPIYDAVLTDLDIDPDEEALVSHEDRFNKIKADNASKILGEKPLDEENDEE